MPLETYPFPSLLTSAPSRGSVSVAPAKSGRTPHCRNAQAGPPPTSRLGPGEAGRAVALPRSPPGSSPPALHSSGPSRAATTTWRGQKDLAEGDGVVCLYGPYMRKRHLALAANFTGPAKSLIHKRGVVCARLAISHCKNPQKFAPIAFSGICVYFSKPQLGPVPPAIRRPVPGPAGLPRRAGC